MRVDLLTRKTIRELRTSRAQTLALIAVVALGVTTFVAAIGAYRDLGASETRTFDQLRFADATFRLTPSPVSIVDETARRDGVTAAAGRLILDTGLPVAGNDRARARLIGITPGRQPVNDLLVIDGQSLTGAGQVLVERHFAEARGIRPGDTVEPLVNGEPVPLKVAGTVATPEYLQVTPDRYELLPSPSGFAVLFVDLAQLQQATGQTGLVNDLAIRTAPGASERVVDQLESDLRARGMLEEVVARADQASYAALTQDLSAFRAIAVSIPTLILLAGVASVAVMLGRTVRAQQPLIGVMKAVGYPDRAVLRHYLTYALVIGAAGSVIGVAAGTALGSVITRAYADELGVPFTTSRFHLGVAAIAVALTLLAVAAAGARPAWQSARIPPALAVRVDVSAAGARSGRSRIERIVALPLRVRIPLRSVGRARGRTLGTVAGIVSAFVLLLMVLGLRDGIGLFVQRVFDDVERWDVSATYDRPQPPDLPTEVAGWPGVRQVSPYLQLPASLSSDNRREEVLVTALEPGQTLHVLRLDTATPTGGALGAGRIVLTNGLAGDLDVGVGDTVTLLSPAGERRLQVGGTSDEPIPARAYVSLAEAARIAGTPTPPFNGLYLRVDPDAVADVRTRLYDQTGAGAVKVRQEMRDDLASLLAVFNVIIAVMLVFALAMAFALVFNAMTVTVLEREREYGTMRAIGARPALIARVLGTEAALLWALALAPGLLVGTWVAGRLGDAVAAGLFDLPVELTTASYAVTAGGLLATVLVALVPPIRRIRRLDLAAATKTLA